MRNATPTWPMLRDVLRRQEFMDDMMERCGVNVLDVIRKDRGQSFVEARTNCRLCARVGTCRQWLLAPNGDVSSPPDFCPNADFFRACLKQEN